MIYRPDSVCYWRNLQTYEKPIEFIILKCSFFSLKKISLKRQNQFFSSRLWIADGNGFEYRKFFKLKEQRHISMYQFNKVTEAFLADLDAIPSLDDYHWCENNSSTFVHINTNRIEWNGKLTNTIAYLCMRVFFILFTLVIEM